MKFPPAKYMVGKVVLPNPIVVASCPATEDCERLLRCAEAGAGAAILKSCHPIGTSLSDEGFRQFYHSDRGLWGTSTVARELLHPDKICSILTYVSNRCDFIVIPSVAGFTLELSEWINTLRLLKPYNPPCVQLDLFYLEEDLSLPNTQRRLRKLIINLQRECGLHLLPKLNQELRPMAALKTFDGTGISGWSLLDSIRTNLPMNPSPGAHDFPNFNHAEELNTASLFGSWQLPLVCEYVFRLRARSNIPILAGGGVQNVTDVVRLLSLGANAVQVATAIIRNGPDWIKLTLSELERWEIGEHCRSAMSPHQPGARVKIDTSLCSSCGRCVDQLMCNAIEMKVVPFVNVNKCEGCGFCLSLCPEHAMTLSTAQNGGYHDSRN